MNNIGFPFASIASAQDYYNQIICEKYKNVSVLISYFNYESRPLNADLIKTVVLTKHAILQIQTMYCCVVAYLENEYNKNDRLNENAMYGEHSGCTRLIGYIPTSVLFKLLVFNSESVKIDIDSFQKQLNPSTIDTTFTAYQRPPKNKYGRMSECDGMISMELLERIIQQRLNFYYQLLVNGTMQTLKLDEDDDFLLHLTSPYRVYYDALSFHAVALIIHSKVCRYYCNSRSMQPIEKWIEFESTLCHYRLLQSNCDNCSFLFGRDVRILRRKHVNQITYTMNEKKHCAVSIFDLAFEDQEDE